MVIVLQKKIMKLIEKIHTFAGNSVIMMNSEPTGSNSMQEQPHNSMSSPHSSTFDKDLFMLVGDFTHTNRMPSSLKNLLRSLYERHIQAPAELLTAIVLYLFLESGFVPTVLPLDVKSKIRTHWGFSFVAQIPDSSWKIVADAVSQEYKRLNGENSASETENQSTSSNATQSEQIYTFQLNLLNHSDDEMQLVIRKIFNESTLCVTFCWVQKQQSTSIILPVSKFINVSFNCDFEQIQQNPQQYFRDIRELSNEIKQNLIAPIRNTVMYESAYPNAALNGMTKETLWLLFSYLRFDLKTIQSVSQTCVYLRNMAISYLNESNIQLKHHRPTPFIYDTTNEHSLSHYPVIHPGSQYRSINFYPWIFLPINY